MELIVSNVSWRDQYILYFPGELRQHKAILEDFYSITNFHQCTKCCLTRVIDLKFYRENYIYCIIIYATDDEVRLIFEPLPLLDWKAIQDLMQQ